MKSIVELDINARQARMAELFANPLNNPRWMDDLERVELISGEPGETGSVYRLVPKRGKMDFVATVLTRALPTKLKLALEGRRVSVLITDTFLRLSDDKTKLISEEVFTFKGAFGKVIGFLARKSIAAAHRRHMESFKRFAESHAS